MRVKWNDFFWILGLSSLYTFPEQSFMSINFYQVSGNYFRSICVTRISGRYRSLNSRPCGQPHIMLQKDMLHLGYGRTWYIWVTEGHITYWIQKDMLHLRIWCTIVFSPSPVTIHNLSFRYLYVELRKDKKCYGLTVQILV